MYDLDETSPVYEWASKLPKTVLIILYNMFVLFTFRFNMNVPGNKGVNDVQGFMTPKQFEAFRDDFGLGKWVKRLPVKGSKKVLPYHKGSFVQEVCLLSSLAELKDWFTMFKNIKP